MITKLPINIPLLFVLLVQPFLSLFSQVSIHLLFNFPKVIYRTTYALRNLKGTLLALTNSMGLRLPVWTCFKYLASQSIKSLRSFLTRRFHRTLHTQRDTFSLLRLYLRFLYYWAIKVDAFFNRYFGFSLSFSHDTLDTFIQARISTYATSTPKITAGETSLAYVHTIDDLTRLTVLLESSSLDFAPATASTPSADTSSPPSCTLSPPTPVTPATPATLYLSPPTPSTPLTPEDHTLINDECNEKLKPVPILSTPKRQPFAPLPIPSIKLKSQTSPVLRAPEHKLQTSSCTGQENKPPSQTKNHEENLKQRIKSKYYRKDTFTAALKIDARPVGEGGFGQVFRAMAVGNQTIAVKLMARTTLAHEIATVNEVKALKAARGCKWAVELVYFQAAREQALIALTYLPGGDMHTYWERTGYCLDFDRARFYTAQLILAIHDLHTRGIIHRDIKLENMMLDSHRNLKVVDFGLAQVFDHTTVCEQDYPYFHQMRRQGGDAFPLLWATSQNPHQTDLANGTEGYAPPEVWKSQMHSFGIDYFAMGCALHLLITGTAPFEFNSAARDYDWDDISIDKNMEIDAYDFLRNVLAPKPEDRPNVSRMKMHPIFRGIDWDALAAGRVEAPPYPHAF